VIQGVVASESIVRENGEGGGNRFLVGLLLIVSLFVYVMGFVHLRADFPNGSPWNDWSKMTDEGWYGGGAIHHFVQGSWYLPDSFNPAVAMPVWPVMLAGWFSVTGVSMVAARVLTLLLYGISLVLLYRVVRLAVPRMRVLAALAVLLTVVNPFCYAFDRLAVLEPVTVFWMMLGLWLAAETKPQDWLRQVLLGIVLGLLLLTKVTGVALVPAVLYLMWASWGGIRYNARVGSTAGSVIGAVGLVVGTMAVLWRGYLRFVVRPHYASDYRLLFSINAYRVHLSIVPRMAWVTMRDGMWIQPVLFVLAMVFVVLSVVWLRELWRVPLFGAAVLAIFGHLAYVGYHTNFQPRYYLVIAMPMAMVIVLGMRAVRERRLGWAGWGVRGAVLVAVGMMMVRTWEYAEHPEYSFLEAAQSVAAVVTADGGARPLLSDSGDDITLMTGLPAIPEAYEVHGLDALLARYQPGWYAAWPGWEDPAIKAVGARYKLDEVARYRVFDDPKRQTLVLYKLAPR
jgi:4-amino-4-deoxy-L-arabinose transferase-like glycosyltransferase